MSHMLCEVSWGKCRLGEVLQVSEGCDGAGADQEKNRQLMTATGPDVKQRHPLLFPHSFIGNRAGDGTQTRHTTMAGVEWGPTSGQGGPVQPWLLVTPVWAAEKTLHTNGWPRTSGNVQAPPASPTPSRGMFRRTGGPPQHRWGDETPWR